MDRVEDRVGEVGPAGRGRAARRRGSGCRGRRAGPGSGPGTASVSKARSSVVLGEAEEEAGTGAGPAPQLVGVARIDADLEARAVSACTASSRWGKGVPGRQPRSMTSAPCRSRPGGAGEDASTSRLGASTISAKMRQSWRGRSRRLPGAAEELRQVLDLLRARARAARRVCGCQGLEVALAAARQDDPGDAGSAARAGGG